jgi:hypothetical protein
VPAEKDGYVVAIWGGTHRKEPDFVLGPAKLNLIKQAHLFQRL